MLWLYGKNIEGGVGKEEKREERKREKGNKMGNRKKKVGKLWPQYILLRLIYIYNGFID